MIKIIANKKGEFPDVWVTSDTHYNHANICRGTTSWRKPDGSIPIKETRDFKNLDLMNDTIVNNINSIVKEDDILIHLGDWSFGGFESIQKFRDRVICKNIHLILGNHDHHIENNKENIQELFLSVSQCNTLKIGKIEIQLMHYPIDSWNNLRKGAMHLHGHCHLPNDKRLGKGKRIDAGIDGHLEFRPYHLMRELVPLLNKQPIHSEIEKDHHTDDMLNVVG
jgi:calcineurin-like phosphoesterase family protein